MGYDWICDGWIDDGWMDASGYIFCFTHMSQSTREVFLILSGLLRRFTKAPSEKKTKNYYSIQIRIFINFEEIGGGGFPQICFLEIRRLLK